MSVGSLSAVFLCLAVVGECAPTHDGVRLQYKEDLKPREAPLDYQEDGPYFEGDLAISPELIATRYGGPYISDSEESLENGPYFEGDLAISPALIATRYGRYASIATAGIRDLDMRWPEGRVFYELDNSISSGTAANIQTAMDWWEKATCIKFALRTDQSDYIHIQSTDSGCYSDFIGHRGEKQILNLQENGCTHPGTIAHELGHNIGLWHEQSRYDRDKYIEVIEENIKPEDLSNFDKLTRAEINTQGLTYDYDSIMHYRANAFSKNGEDTIVILNREVYADQGSPSVGQRDHLSRGDIDVINRLYDCPGSRDKFE